MSRYGGRYGAAKPVRGAKTPYAPPRGSASGSDVAKARREKRMKPSEVIAMRDQLSAELDEEYGVKDLRVADWLIGSGWVVAPPKNEGETSE